MPDDAPIKNPPLDKINLDDILGIIQRIPDGKSPGVDGLCPKHVKHLFTQVNGFGELMVKIYNLMFQAPEKFMVNGDKLF